MSLADIISVGKSSQEMRTLQLSAVADSTGMLHVNDRTALSEILSAKRNGTLQKLDGWFPLKDAREAVNSADADVIVDCTTTNYRDAQPSLDCMLAAIRKGMDVVTANKGPLALQMRLIMDEASKSGRSVKFGATVGGGTPFIDFGMMCSAGTEIRSMSGVLNGTTNYVLTRMGEGLSMQDALAEAKDSGIAESDPANDLKGLDSAAKIVILANSLTGAGFSMKDVAITGIEGVTVDSLAEARRAGGQLRLVSTYDAALRALSVSPLPVSISDHINVSGMNNAVTYRTANGNEYTLIGAGAGVRETARAILRDLLSLPRR